MYVFIMDHRNTRLLLELPLPDFVSSQLIKQKIYDITNQKSTPITRDLITKKEGKYN